MSDYNRNGGDDFDWESFDRKTSNPARENDTGSSPPLRRRRNGSSHTRQAQRRRDDTPAGRRTTGARYADNRRPEKKRRKKKQLTEKQILFRKRLRLTILVAVMVCIVVCSGMFVGMYAAVSREIKDMNIQGLALNYASVIYYTDANGTEQELDKINSDSNRIWVDSDEISQYFKDAVVSIEDERFYSHHGVDIKRTLGATVQFIASKVGLGQSTYGGSTDHTAGDQEYNERG